MAHGDIHAVSSVADDVLPVGSTRTASGRISSAAPRGNVPVTAPFTTAELVALDEVITWATLLVGVRFSVFVGDFNATSSTPEAITHSVAAIFAHAPEPENGCLIAVSPNTKDVVVLSGINVRGRITDNTCRLGVSAVLSSLREGNLIDGFIAAIRVIVSAIKNL